MITEDYVSYETAKLLKEKGFEYNLDESYWLIDADNKMYWVSHIGAYDYVDIPTESFQRPKNGYRLITQATAMKWLREVHHLHISIEMGFDVDNHQYFFFVPSVCKFSSKTGEYQTPFGETEFDTYEEAVESVIKYCLEKLI